MAERFFWATAREGRLCLPDIPPWDFLDAKRLLYRTTAEVDVLVRSGTVDRIARTVEDLSEALEASERDAGSVSLYIHESLLRNVARRWEERRAKPVDAPEPVDPPAMPAVPPVESVAPAESVAASATLVEVSAMSVEVPPALGDAPAGEGLSDPPRDPKTEV
jgi:hypothetical protein